VYSVNSNKRIGNDSKLSNKKLMSNKLSKSKRLNVLSMNTNKLKLLNALYSANVSRSNSSNKL